MSENKTFQLRYQVAAEELEEVVNLAVNVAAKTNAAYYNLILHSEKTVSNTFASLKQRMTKNEDDW